MMLVEEKDKRFYIKKSNIKDAGMGVFASEDIKKGSYLEIIGVMVNVDSVADQCTNFAKDYKFAAQYEDKYTRHIIPMGYAAIINHATEEKNQKHGRRTRIRLLGDCQVLLAERQEVAAAC